MYACGGDCDGVCTRDGQLCMHVVVAYARVHAATPFVRAFYLLVAFLRCLYSLFLFEIYLEVDSVARVLARLGQHTAREIVRHTSVLPMVNRTRLSC